MKKAAQYHYRVILITSESRTSEWISNLKTFIDSIVKKKDIKDVSSLSLEELVDKFDKIHIKLPKGICQKAWDCLFSKKEKKQQE